MIDWYIPIFRAGICTVVLTACSPSYHAIYQSSESEDLGYIVDLSNGSYTKKMGGAGGGVPTDGSEYKLVVVRGNDYLYETQFRIVIPLNDSASKWGDGSINCVTAPSSEDRKLRNIECVFRKVNVVSKFVLDDERGIVKFTAGCFFKPGACEYVLKGGKGIFSKGDRLRDAP